MPIGRKIEDEREAVRCLRAAERRGLGAGEWARVHGVDGRSLNAWRVNLARRGTSGPAKRREKQPKAKRTARALVELVSATTGARAGYALVVAGARIEFGDDVSVATLRRVLEALRSC